MTIQCEDEGCPTDGKAEGGRSSAGGQHNDTARRRSGVEGFGVDATAEERKVGRRVSRHWSGLGAAPCGPGVDQVVVEESFEGEVSWH